ncbi:peptidoglycan-binding protein, partial [Candidatus Kaiserbacteria bacterium]|nr:peptidoglycan-binding protein [Candidatus Kaiserbacteria bacterium]
MTVITQSFASKLSVAFVAIAMMFMAVAPAQAQTAEELQAEIAKLMATINQLQSQIGQGATNVASGICPYTWTRTLTSGSTGDDVMKLQQFLNASEDTRVAATGAGSVGAETMYFGPATAAAVQKFQVKYRADILTPNGLVNPVPHFGPSTMAKANALCTSAPVDNGDGDNGDDGDMDNGDVELSGEASLEDFEIDDADDSDVEEGQNDVEVAEITVTFEDGDASISRLDLAFTSASSTSPWDAFENFSLWVDGEMIAEHDADSKSDYLGDEEDGVIRFSGLDLVAMDG